MRPRYLRPALSMPQIYLYSPMRGNMQPWLRRCVPPERAHPHRLLGSCPAQIYRGPPRGAVRCEGQEQARSQQG